MKLLNKNNNIYIWAALSVGLFAGSSFVMLMVTLWMFGVYWAGVFSIGLAMSQQMYTIGCFCVRGYQASDINEVYDFSAYLNARFITGSLMLVVGITWIMIGIPSGTSIFDNDKAMVFLWFLLYKASESFSDVLGGRYQQKGRFDISCKIMFFKTLFALLCFCIGVCVFRSLPQALLLSFIAHVLGTVLLDGRMVSHFDLHLKIFMTRRAYLLLFSCLPLAIDSFLRMYINNGSKFAIDIVLDKESVAIFSTLFMISFIMSVFSEFILNPRVTIIAEAFNFKRYDIVRAIVKKQIFLMLCFGAVGLILSYFCGVEILSFIFKINLVPYRQEFCTLFLGGILLSLFNLTQLLLVIQRKQLWCLPGVISSALFVFFMANFLVDKFKIMGGAITYLISMAIMFCFGVFFVVLFFKKRIKENEM